MEISEHISYKEVTYSQTAIRNDINNEPNDEQLYRIIRISENIFEPLREWVGGPIKINSCFRSAELNKRIGGAQSSQHCANKGAAFDLDDTYGYKTNAEMFHYIKDNLDFDQLIGEFPNGDGNPSWVHVSYKEDNNRGQILIAVKNPKTSYIVYEGNENLIK